METDTSNCELLEKLTLLSLHLMEDKMECEMAVESTINEGTIHLSKSRYIMGQNSVSAVQLPTGDSPEFSASLVCDRDETTCVPHLTARKSEEDNTANPIKWFGVLVPKSLHKAQGAFRSALEYAVECANVNIKLASVLSDIKLLKESKV